MLPISVVSILCLHLVLSENIVPRQLLGGIEGVRLTRGRTERAGRVQIMSQGVWGCVCDDMFDNDAARVVCRSLGFSNSTGFAIRSTDHFGPVDRFSAILLDDVVCLGNESSLNECEHSAIGDNNCNHEEDVGIVCPLETGIESIRLVGGMTERAGRVQVMSQGVWGAVCNDHFDSNAATVVCRSLNSRNTTYGNDTSDDTGFVVRTPHIFSPANPTTPILLDDVTCRGNEASLNECDHRPIGDHDCSYYEVVGIVCGQGGIDDIRLANGPDERSGRVEIMLQGVWGTVCDDFFDNNAAIVVCSSLGFRDNTGHVVSPRIGFSPAHFNTRILLDDVSCHGNESSLSECEHRVFGENNCLHHEDVGIACGQIVTQVRLVNGSNLKEGRLEVLVNGTWGTVCDDAFSEFSAQVICRMLELP